MASDRFVYDSGQAVRPAFTPCTYRSGEHLPARPLTPLVSLHAAREGGFVVPEQGEALNETTTTEKTEQTKVEADVRPLTNVAVTPSVSETTKTETKVEIKEDDGA